jgi:uncharacterized protein YqeY
MGLWQQFEEDVKKAMLAGDALRRDTLRMILAAFKNRRIELGRDLEQADELDVLSSAVKSRQDSARQYEQAGRDELARKEQGEIEIIQGYLPRPLSEEETRKAVAEVVAELGVTQKQELGKVMKAVMARYKGQVDGKLVQHLAAESLG